MIHIYDSGQRGPCRSEDCEQIDAMGWLEKHYPERWPLIWHTPNEIRASPLYMQKRKKMGVKSGVSDIVDFGLVRGAFELKKLDRKAKGVRVSAAQRKFLQAVADTGGFAAICYGFEQFKLAYADYLRFISERS